MSSPSITERLAGLLARTAPFDTLSEAQRSGLISTLELYEPGEVILEQGVDVHRALYVVESGLVRLMDAETQRIFDICGEGAQFGSYGLMQGGILPYEARAVEQTTCALIAADTFRALLKENEQFRLYFEEDIKRYVRSLSSDLDASGAYLLFDTPLASLVTRQPVTAAPETPVRDVARAMRAGSADTAIVVRDGAAVGVVTEGDMVRKVVAEGIAPETPVMSLIERPPVALAGTERLFDAVRVMMRQRIRRVVVVERGSGDTPGALLGVLTTEDVAHVRGLDPVATTERMERAGTVDELASIRIESTRRMFRLYQQGVQSEDLMGVVNDLDDQLKRQLLVLSAREVAASGVEVFEGAWSFLTFGSPGRRESTLIAHQDNGLVWADQPDAESAQRAQTYFTALAARANSAFERCGFHSTEIGLLARDEAFRQPLSAWRAAYTEWTRASDAGATDRAAVVFDVRNLYGDDSLAEALLGEVASHLPNDRLTRVLLHRGTRAHIPLGFLGRFELDRDEAGREGLDLRERALLPAVSMARALAIDAGYLRSGNTFDRLRHVAGASGPSAGDAQELLGAYMTLSDLNLRHQMQLAERGERPTDRIDPASLLRSQQNLLREALKSVETVQRSLRDRYGEP